MGWVTYGFNSYRLRVNKLELELEQTSHRGRYSVRRSNQGFFPVLCVWERSTFQSVRPARGNAAAPTWRLPAAPTIPWL